MTVRAGVQASRYMDGFQLVGPAYSVSAMAAAAVSIAKGDLLIDNGSGYLTNAGITAFAGAITYYVAIEPCDNSAGTAGDLDVLCVPAWDSRNQFWAPNESSTVAARTDVGEIVDLESEDGIDVTDTSIAGMGFAIEDIDISAAAVAAETGGYVKGRFWPKVEAS